PFPDLPNIGIKFPHSPITVAAFAYSKEHTSEMTYNHCVRSAYWALILAKKLPNFASASSPPLNLETVVLTNILHDMGWATTKEILSKDKRFEVDGANLAHEFIRRYAQEGGEGAEKWKNDDRHRAHIVWDAIALHTTPSFALHHPAPEVTLAHMGIMVDFSGPKFGDGNVITEAEYREVVRHFPLAGLGTENMKITLCGLCREKPETTYDNIVGQFG
ncbi:hypothetical protein M434DRAFT_41229, partial [Hypoxylon sp. CO27-5]